MNQHLLSIILFTPLAGALILLFVDKRNQNAIRWIANIVALIGFAVSVPLWFWYQPAGADFQFIDRKAVARERERQLRGEVKTSGVDAAPAGADMVLDIELIALRGGATNTVQYTFKLTELNGIVVWTNSETIVKRN